MFIKFNQKIVDVNATSINAISMNDIEVRSVSNQALIAKYYFDKSDDLKRAMTLISNAMSDSKRFLDLGKHFES